MAGSDLDCDGYPTTHIVGLGSMPMNTIQHTTGTDTSFMPFYNTGLTPAATTSLSVNTPGISGSGRGAYEFAIATTNAANGSDFTSFTLYATSSSGIETHGPTLTKSLASGTDLNSATDYFVSYTGDGYLMRINRWTNMGYVNWTTPEYYPPPSGTAFQYSPTVCGGTVFATAGDRLWYLNLTTLAWDKVTETPVASGPDCTMSSAGWNLVVLTGTGQILYGYNHSGTTGPGSAAFVDLGAY